MIFLFSMYIQKDGNAVSLSPNKVTDVKQFIDDIKNGLERVFGKSIPVLITPSNDGKTISFTMGAENKNEIRISDKETITIATSSGTVVESPKERSVTVKYTGEDGKKYALEFYIKPETEDVYVAILHEYPPTKEKWPEKYPRDSEGNPIDKDSKRILADDGYPIDGKYGPKVETGYVFNENGVTGGVKGWRNPRTGCGDAYFQLK